jgi:hypothetical protein
MSQPSTNTVFGTDKLNEVLLTSDTGAVLGALSKYFAGMLVFCTSSGGIFVAGRLYQRNVANDGWNEIADLTSTQTWTNKSISGASNTFSNIGSSSITGGVIDHTKLAHALTKYAPVSISAAESTTSTTLVDTSASSAAAITAVGNKAGLITEACTNYEADAGGRTITINISDGGGTMISEKSYISIGINLALQCLITSYEDAPAAGSLTRKIKWKVSAGTAYMNNGGLTKGISIYVMELL